MGELWGNSYPPPTLFFKTNFVFCICPCSSETAPTIFLFKTYRWYHQLLCHHLDLPSLPHFPRAGGTTAHLGACLRGVFVKRGSTLLTNLQCSHSQKNFKHLSTKCSSSSGRICESQQILLWLLWTLKSR